MTCKNQERILGWGCAKAVAVSASIVVIIACIIDGWVSTKEQGSPYSAALV